MRILHTADWHLGKMFYGGYLTEEQAYILTDQFLPMIQDEHIDAVILAGDVYDRSIPPAPAVELFDEVATKITAELGVPFFIISGNHDSAARLSFASTILEKQGLFISGDLMKLGGAVTLDDTYGPVDFVPVPYAEPDAVRHLYDDAVHDHESALAALIGHQRGRGKRQVCIAHAYVAGGITCDSERPLSIGASDIVPASLFDGFTYTALGHLHGPQKAGGDTVRYAGSLLKYSFGEWKQKKGAVVVDIDGDGKAATTFLPFASHRDVRIIEGFFDDIMKDDSSRSDDFLLVRLLDRTPILDGMAKLREKFPNVLAMETPNRQGEAASDRPDDVRGVSEQQLFASFAQAMRQGAGLTEAEQACVNSLWQELMKEEGGGLL